MQEGCYGQAILQSLLTHASLLGHVAVFLNVVTGLPALSFA